MKPNAQRGKIAVAFIWITLVIEIIAGISNYFQMNLLISAQNGETITMEYANANDIRQLIIALIQLLIYIGTIITFIMWFRRGYYNLHRLIKVLSFSEGWAAGTWFVPFVNLVRPYKIMKEMMYESEELLVKGNLIEPKKSRVMLVGVWWTLLLINNIATNAVTRIEIRSTDLSTLINTSGASVILSLFAIPLTIVTVKMMKSYMEMEELLPLLEDKPREIKIDDSDILDSI